MDLLLEASCEDARDGCDVDCMHGGGGPVDELLRGDARGAADGLRGSFLGRMLGSFPPDVAHRLLLSSLTAAIE